MHMGEWLGFEAEEKFESGYLGKKEESFADFKAGNRESYLLLMGDFYMYRVDLSAYIEHCMEK